MSGIDDYNDRMRKQAMGVPVTPPTTAVQASIDMAADADRRAPGADVRRGWIVRRIAGSWFP
ncbi:MAG: hypothetical protein ACK4P2_01275 [Hyphomonas sp.]